MNPNTHAIKSDYDTDIRGAEAEMAVAKAFNVFYVGDVNMFKAPDVGEFQVRSTTHPEGHLLVRQNDSDDEMYVFVVNHRGRCRIVGGMLGREAKQDKYWRDGTNGQAGCWWVPQGDLRAIAQESSHGRLLQAEAER